ncbi:hypothetical protein DFH09DRAFT_1074043 [Mycena vulgaris]|nr:hypothetical protein DFH09DRAFT_1074043 [Mycena vulgaris]
MSNTMTVDPEGGPSRDSSPLSEPPVSIVTGNKARNLDAPRPLLPGMIGGYARSPMAEIKQEFEAETEQDHSLCSRVIMVVNKRDLDPRDLRDRGISLSETFPRFQLDTGVGMRLTSIISEFQTVIQKAALLIPSRRPQQFFVIDPHSTLIGVLRGAETMDEMTIAWHALRRRLELGLSYLDKYDSEYKASTDRDVLISPVSTAPEVYDNLAGYSKSSTNNVAKLTYLYENVPHLRDTMPSEWQKEPSWLPAWIEAPTYLKNAFPDRDPERRPATLYYSTDGVRRELEVPATSSWRASEDYVAPPLEPSDSRRGKAAKRVSIAPVHAASGNSERDTAEWERDTSIKYPRVNTATESSNGDFEDKAAESSAYVPTQTAPLYGSSTPFKTPAEFFPPVPKSREGLASTHQVPNTDLPNALHGLAAPLSYGYGRNESISQVKRQPRPPYSDYRYSSWSRDTPPGILSEKALTRLLVVTLRIQEVTQRIRRMMTKDQEEEVPPEGRHDCQQVEKILLHQTGAMVEQDEEARQEEGIPTADKEELRKETSLSLPRLHTEQ